jgi:hypothetical protein
MKELNSETDCKTQLDLFEQRVTNSLLVIDGETLNNCVFRKPMEQNFF